MAESITDLLNELRNLTNTLHYATGGLSGISGTLDKVASVSGAMSSINRFASMLSGPPAPVPPSNSQIAGRFAEFAGIEPMDFQEKFRQSIGLSPSMDAFRNQTLGFLDQIKSQGAGAQSQLFNPLFQQFLNQGGANPLSGAAAAASDAGGAGGAGGIAGLLGGAGGAGGAGMALLSNPVGWMVAAALFVGAVVEAGPAVKDFAKSVLEEQRKFAEVSGSMAVVFAMQDVRDLMRDMQTGDRTARSAGNLSSAYGDLADTTQSIEILLTDLKNEVLADFVKLINIMLKPLSEVAKFGNEIGAARIAVDACEGIGLKILFWLTRDNEDKFDENMNDIFQKMRDDEVKNRDGGKKVMDNMRDRQRKIGVAPNK